jgi:hypothetical protein
MKRFLMLVGVAVVAAAMYVAASPASQKSSGPTEKQFVALEKKVATLSKTLKTVKSEANSAVGFIATCLVSQNAGALPTGEFGDLSNPATFGYSYTPSGGVAGFTTALDIDRGATPQGYLQIVDGSCVGPAGLRHRLAHSGSAFSLARPERLHH